jgi:hypothetical protein
MQQYAAGRRISERTYRRGDAIREAVKKRCVVESTVPQCPLARSGAQKSSSSEPSIGTWISVRPAGRVAASARRSWVSIRSTMVVTP